MSEYASSDPTDSIEALEVAALALTPATAYAAFRIWRLIDGVLLSPYRDEPWDQPVVRAICPQSTASARLPPGVLAIPHRAPHLECRCGIYVSEQPNVGFSHVDFRGVTGIVTVWGAIVREPEGARAEFARVAALGVYSHWTARQKRAVKEAAQRLEADVVDLRTLDSAAGRYGSPLPARSSV
jgi:hypothetical protein